MSNKLRNAKYLLQAIFADILPQDPGDLDETKYVFIHIPKTAGTSFMMMLYEHIPAGKIYPNPKEYFINNKGNYPSLQQLLNRKQSADILRKRKWLAGHFKYQSACALVPNAFLITFLRDPFDRVVSEIVHIKTNHKIHRARSIEAIITKRLKIMGTMQALTFGYLPRKDNLKQAIDNLGTCQFIGLTEKMTESIDRLNTVLGTSFRLGKAVNVGELSLKEEVIHTYGDRIRENLSVDAKFYEYGVRLIEELA